MGRIVEQPDSHTPDAGHCLFVIPSPSDDVIHGGFRAIAQRWRVHVTGERLWIEGDVPMSASLTTPVPSPALERLLAFRADVIARIDLNFDGLTFSYVRSGGHGPVMYRKSFFDEVRVELEGYTSVQEHDLGEMLRELCTSLEVGRGTASPKFMPLLEQLQSGTARDHQKSL